MNNISDVIKVNASAVLNNAICFYFWENREVETTLKKYEQRIKEDYTIMGINFDMSLSASIELFKSYISKAKKDCSFIYKDQKDNSVSPKINSFKDYCKENGLPFKHMADMQYFIDCNF